MRLRSLIDKNKKKCRVTNMLTSASFKREFDIVKQSVLELKNELYAYLDMSEEEQIYTAMQRGAALSEAEEIPFRAFVLAFETFLLGSADMAPEVKRGLKISILKGT